MRLIHSDCLEVLRTMDSDSIDALVTDPPAGISFMGKEWDHHKGGRKEWCAWLESVMRECVRVMKPGAHGFVWALPRTSHWTATALEDAGFEIRDCVYHLFGSGFPKSMNVSIAIDKQAGAMGSRGKAFVTAGAGSRQDIQNTKGWEKDPGHTSITDAAKQWQGFGTALKPAVECWWLVRKPLSEKTVAKNVLKWGTGAINIDASRIEGVKPQTVQGGRSIKGGAFNGNEEADPRRILSDASQGRFPANLIHDEEAGAMLDEQSGTLKAAGNKDQLSRFKKTTGGSFSDSYKNQVSLSSDSGGASRFFYCAKVSASERGKDNKHPTVKAQKLMRYLCKMITPPGGTILDPFMGSGSTGLAAKTEGFHFVGIEREQEYFEIAQKRIESWIQSNASLL